MKEFSTDSTSDDVLARIETYGDKGMTFEQIEAQVDRDFFVLTIQKYFPFVYAGYDRIKKLNL